MDIAKGVINNRFVREMETPQAQFIQLWSGELPYNVKNAAILNTLGSILSQRYLKSIREEGSMAYSVGAYGSLSYGLTEEYKLQVYCPVKPAKMDSALMLVRLDIDNIARDGVTEDELNQVKLFELKEFADRQRENSYWQGEITALINWGKEPSADYEAVLKNLSSDDIRNFVRDVLLKQNNCITVSMLPADFSEE